MSTPTDEDQYRTANGSALSVSDEDRADLETARALARQGVPYFIAHPVRGPDGARLPDQGVGGYRVPRNWQNTPADPSAIDRWQPGDGLGLVTGLGLDVVDMDPRHGGELSLAGKFTKGEVPEILARCRTPSGGVHLVIPALGVRSRDNLYPGIDIKAGGANGEGRGFVWAPPTRRRSKATGRIERYRYEVPPDTERTVDLAGEWTEPRTALARQVRIAHRELAAVPDLAAEASGAEPMMTGPGSVEEALRPPVDHTGPVRAGGRDSYAISYAGYLRTRGVGLDLAERAMRDRWREFEQPPGDRYSLDAAVEKLTRVYANRPGGSPDLAPDDSPTGNPLRSFLRSRTEMLSQRRPDCLIGDTLDRGTTVLVFGPWGSYKSFLALAWALSVASGRPWNGRRCDQGTVLYVAAEGAWGMGERLRAWESEYGPVPEDRFHLLRGAVHLGSHNAVGHLVDLVGELDATFIVIDTLAKSTPGVEENSAREMGVVVSALERIRDATPGGRGVVVAVHHARKSTDDSGRPVARGSVAVEAGVDVVYRLTKADPVVADRTKRKDGPESDRFAMTLRAVGDGAVLDYGAPSADDLIDTERPQTRQARANRDRVEAVIRQHEQVPDQRVDIGFIVSATKLARTTVRDCLSDLADWGRVERVPSAGSDTDRTVPQ